MTVAVASGVTALRWRCTTSSATPRPSETSPSTAPASSCHSRRRWGRRSMTEPTVMAWSSFSTTQAVQSVSYRIQYTCSVDDVG